MRIITGYSGYEHITSNDDQALNQGIFGNGNYILDIGERFNATLTDATTVTIEDGDGVMQGVHFRIEPGTTEEIFISPGTTGYNRIDLICARYTKDAGTGIEDVSLAVIEGTPSDSTPSAPSYNTGDILNGDLLVDFPLWTVTVTGLSPALTRFSATQGLSGLLNFVYPVGSIYMSVNSTSPASLFGGTWEQLQNRFLLGAGSSYSGGSTGGEASHTLTVNEIPSHRHEWELWQDTYQSYQINQSNPVSAYTLGTNENKNYTTYIGGGAAHNNMPPYLAVYMWKRTA